MGFYSFSVKKKEIIRLLWRFTKLCLAVSGENEKKAAETQFLSILLAYNLKVWVCLSACPSILEKLTLLMFLYNKYIVSHVLQSCSSSISSNANHNQKNLYIDKKSIFYYTHNILLCIGHVPFFESIFDAGFKKTCPKNIWMPISLDI